jgi:hypothetical protein
VSFAFRSLGALGFSRWVRVRRITLRDQHLRRLPPPLAEPKQTDVQRWRGYLDARRAVYGNRPGCISALGKEAFKLRAERVERSFEHTLYLVHVAAYNLGLVMRALLGAGTPRELAAKGGLLLWFFDPAAGFVVIVLPPPTLRQTPVHQIG